eukprot:3245312-Amphidinium_carterae.1
MEEGVFMSVRQQSTSESTLMAELDTNILQRALSLTAKARVESRMERSTEELAIPSRILKHLNVRLQRGVYSARLDLSGT